MIPSLLVVNFGVTSLASDVWSLGIVALEMAQGRAPMISTHSSHEAVAAIGAYRQGPAFNKSRLSSQLNQFLEACLCVDPRNRATVNELLDFDFITQRKAGVDLARQVNIAKFILSSKKR